GRGRGEDTRRGVVTSVYARLHHLSRPRHDGYLPPPPAGCSILCQYRHFDLHRARLPVLGGGRADSRRLGCRVPGEGRPRGLRNLMKVWRPGARRAHLWLPIFLALKAEAHAKAGRSDTALNVIEEALAVSDETGERRAVAEVLRVKGGWFQASGRAADDEIENLLIKSLETGRRQQALSWQLRTACDLARLWQGQGRGEEALTLLQSIYDQFTEGFNTTDLIHARALLEGLCANSV